MDTRTIQKKVNEEWQTIEFNELLNGDTFRMFESTGEPVIGNKNDTEFLATSNAYLNEDKVWQIDVVE